MGNKRVTPEEIKDFFRLYEIHGSYAAVAKITGRSAATIAKYVKTQGQYKSLKMAARHEITKYTY